MTTSRDLLIVAMDMASTRSVERGDLSLALAGAEAIDLLGARAITLDGDRIVPGYRPAKGDPLLDEAASSLVAQAPYEPVGDWLWRRGRDLSTAYLAALVAEGLVVGERRRRWVFFRTSEMVLVDSPARREAADRWRSDEPVLADLASAVGIRDKPAREPTGRGDESVAKVLSAVHDALEELAAERQRRVRKLDQAAEDNVQRGY